MSKTTPTGGDAAKYDELVDAIVALDPQPRKQCWVSLSLCIVDAVWSIGARYEDVVVPLVRNLAKEFGVEQPTVPVSEPLGADPLPVTRLSDLSVNELIRSTNWQNTSTRGGIRKADAVLRHTRVFLKHDVSGLAETIVLFSDERRFAAVNADLGAIPGEGAHAVRRDYLWMLIGQDDLINPDRMVLRWFSRHRVIVDPIGARDLIAAFVPAVSTRLKRSLTAWEIDHALWDAGRRL
jgi:hypothetical protein